MFSKCITKSEELRAGGNITGSSLVMHNPMDSAVQKASSLRCAKLQGAHTDYVCTTKQHLADNAAMRH